ncbi:hypothetical protein JW851_00505 [Candidatus Woesearchaeota archaeon]|nr:hypothetical protein [Candidatus Woesearchaeota archaeon]
MKKRGQKAVPGSAAGALVGIITLLIIFYIILIPPSERQKLLADETYISGEPENIILQEYIGRISSIEEDSQKHLVPNIYLKEITESTILAQENSFMIKKGITTQYKTINFVLEDPEYVDNVLISFNTPQHTGTLKVFFNSYAVFEGQIDTESPQPIHINKNYLEKNNKVELQVHGLGVPAKIYAFENFRIIGDLTNVKKQEASHLITITSSEYNNLESAYLDYMPICNQKDIGVLEVSLNNRELVSGMPNCNSLARTDLYSDDLQEGRNEISFRLLSGTINIEQIRLKTFLKTEQGWSRYFYITEQQYSGIQDGSAMLEIEFADDGYAKEMQISLNGEIQNIDQKEPYFVRDVSSVIKQGNNYISIKPESDLNILELEVRVE